MKKFKFFFILLFSITSLSQVTDTIIDRGIYQSHFSYKLQEPLFVVYKLYKGGGTCDRSKFYFKNDTGMQMADNPDYTNSGFDRGHMAAAEDFAYDCQKGEMTFRYYNCIPQTPNLNRGIWKTWENKIRTRSQLEPLLIICGGIWTTKTVNGMAIPNKCWKIVVSQTTKKVIYCLLFTNVDYSSAVSNITLATLEKITGQPIGAIIKAN